MKKKHTSKSPLLEPTAPRPNVKQTWEELKDQKNRPYQDAADRVDEKPLAEPSVEKSVEKKKLSFKSTAVYLMGAAALSGLVIISTRRRGPLKGWKAKMLRSAEKEVHKLPS